MSTNEVLAAVAAAPNIKTVPGDLTPQLEDAAADGEKPQGTCSEPLKVKDSLSGECTYGDAQGLKTVVLLGDSHAGMWSTSFDLAAKRAGWKLRAFAQGGCPAPRITFSKDDAPNVECDRFRADAIAAIVQSRPDLVVVTSATFFQKVGKGEFATPEMWDKGLGAVLHDLAASGAKIVVLGDLPVLAQPAPECLAAHEHEVSKCGTARDAALDHVYHGAEQAAATRNGARYIDPTPWLCSDVCWPIVGRMLVYRNRHHLTATYAAFLSETVGAALDL